MTEQPTQGPEPDRWRDGGGSFAHENWRAFDAHERPGDAHEYPLFTDARVAGEARFGPYTIINAIQDIPPNPQYPALVLRADSYVSWSYSNMDETETGRYHGGTAEDEVAALLSLALGCRLKAGSPSRWFKVNGDPKGRPWSFRSPGRGDPVPPTASRYGPLLPDLLPEKQVGSAEPLMRRFRELPGTDSVALVRAARSYQEAVWIAESDPALAWLQLVSAIEVASNHWQRGQASPADRLRTSRPDVYRVLFDAGGESLATTVAGKFADYLGATRKFVDFCSHFLPSPPATRPATVEARLPWEARAKMKRALAAVYKHRSNALHAGTPFPAPMCAPPSRIEAVLPERLPFLAAGAYGGTWRQEDIPMFLHIFEYIVRGSLLKWWLRLASAATEGSATGDGAPAV